MAVPKSPDGIVYRSGKQSNLQRKSAQRKQLWLQRLWNAQYQQQHHEHVNWTYRAAASLLCFVQESEEYIPGMPS